MGEQLDALRQQRKNLGAALSICRERYHQVAAMDAEAQARLEADGHGLPQLEKQFSDAFENHRVVTEEIKALEAAEAERAHEEDATPDDVARHEAEGHTAHCARRIAYGDGECECRVRRRVPVPDSMVEALGGFFQAVGFEDV